MLARPAALVSVLAGLAAPWAARAAEPLDVTDATPRSVAVQFEDSADLSSTGQSFGSFWPAAWSVSGNVGRVEISIETHEQLRDPPLDNMAPVPGTFEPIVIEIDLSTLEATTLPTSGAFTNGTQSFAFATFALDSTGVGGFASPGTPWFCSSQAELDMLCAFIPSLCGKVCILVPGAAFDPLTGNVNMIGLEEQIGCDGQPCFDAIYVFTPNGDLRLSEDPPPPLVPSASAPGRMALVVLLGAAASTLLWRRWRGAERA